MSTFSISDTMVKGTTGAKGDHGHTGTHGHTGIRGATGHRGVTGHRGPQGDTGFGITGIIGVQGVTGITPDKDLQLYLKFKNDDDTLIDYSIYERDLQWDIGVTGNSYYTLESGIVDGCLAMEYQGNPSGFRRNIYLGLTGVGIVAAWINIDVKPIASYTMTRDSLNPLKIKFHDTSTYFPTSWLWDFGDTYQSSAKNTEHTYSYSGQYMVSLTASNQKGSNTLTSYITV